VSAPTSSGSSGSFTATVNGVPHSAGTPTGTVTFTVAGLAGPVQCDGGSDTLAMSSGTATCTISSALVASGSPYSVQAAYSGDGNFNPSASTSKSLKVRSS